MFPVRVFYSILITTFAVVEYYHRERKPGEEKKGGKERGGRWKGQMLPADRNRDGIYPL